jgi:hypothetical protein
LSARAAIRKADLRRAIEAARETGCVLVVNGATMKFLPADSDAAQPPAPAQPDEDWDKALGLK